MNISGILTYGLPLNLMTCLLVTFIVAIFLWIWRSSTKSLNLAPGPTGYPILGHLPLLMKNPFIKLIEYRKIYGPVFSIRFGRKHCTVLGNFSAIKEIFKTQGQSTRVSELFSITPEYDLLIAMNGMEWHDRRRFAISVLRGTDRERSTENIIQEEVNKLVENIEKMDLSHDIELGKVLSVAANNIAFSMLYGKTFDEDHIMMKQLTKFQHAILEHIQWQTFATSVELPKFIYNNLIPQLKASKKIIKEMDDLIRKEIAEHEKTLNPGNPRDFIDLALMEMQKSEGYKKIHDSRSIRGDIQTLITAGTETVRVTMEWCLLLLAKYPSIQEKVYKEIVDILGDRQPTWADHTRLPYLEAFIMESQRIFTIVPLTLFRCAKSNTKINGFDIPQGAWFVANLWGAHHDPDLWPEPEKFDPNRFLNKEGDKVVEPEMWIPFAIGNRNCLGDKMAKTEVFITVATLIQHYRVFPSSKGVCLEGTLLLDYRPVNSELRIQKRKDLDIHDGKKE